MHGAITWFKLGELAWADPLDSRVFSILFKGMHRFVASGFVVHLPAVIQNGWVLDEGTKSFQYTGSAKEPEDSLVLGQVQKLTEYVFHLEQ